MTLSTLIYYSRPQGCGAAEVDAILNAATRRNAARGLTGALVFHADFFMQTLEGPRDAISDLYAEILGDPRHTQVTLMLFDDIAVRRFGDWSMRYLPILKSGEELIASYAGDGAFDPARLSGADAFALFSALGARAGERAA